MKNIVFTAKTYHPSGDAGGDFVAKKILMLASRRKNAALIAHRFVVGVLAVDMAAMFIEPNLSVQWILLSAKLTSVCAMLVCWGREAKGCAK